MPEELAKTWPNSQCVIVTDLSHWNELRSNAEKKFVPTRNLINNIGHVILIIDPDSGKILDANKMAVDFYGYSLDTLKGMYISSINILPMEAIRLK